MPDHIVRSEVISSHQPCHKLDQRLIRRIVKFTTLILNTAFDRDRILIPVIRRIGDLITRNTLYNLTLKSDHKVAARGSLMRLSKSRKIVTVLSGGRSRIGCIMNDNALDLSKFRSWAGILIDRKKLYIKLGAVCNIFRGDNVLCIGKGCLSGSFMHSLIQTEHRDQNDNQNNNCYNTTINLHGSFCFI